jgi:hypothetical protein
MGIWVGLLCWEEEYASQYIIITRLFFRAIGKDLDDEVVNN